MVYTYDAAFTVTLRAPDGTERTLKIRKEWRVRPDLNPTSATA